MDPVTHAFLGAACSQAILYKKDKRNAWLVGGLAAMAPDLDIFISDSSNPMLFFLYHRFFTHSLIFIPIGALIVSLALLIFKRFRTNWKYTFLAALIGYATHGLLDACTTYGTVLFWPFSNIRVSWDIVSIVDPIITVTLCLGVVTTFIFNKRQPVIIALMFVGLFFLFNTYQHNRALEAVHSNLTQMQLQPKKIRVIPKLLSSTTWRGIALAQDQLHVFEASTPLFKESRSQFIKSYPYFSSLELPKHVKESPSLLRDFVIFNWFSEEFLIFVNNKPLLLADGRFLTDNAKIALWSVLFLPNQPHVKVLNGLDIESYKSRKE